MFTPTAPFRGTALRLGTRTETRHSTLQPYTTSSSRPLSAAAVAAAAAVAPPPQLPLPREFPVLAFRSPSSANHGRTDRRRSVAPPRRWRAPWPQSAPRRRCTHGLHGPHDRPASRQEGTPATAATENPTPCALHTGGFSREWVDAASGQVDGVRQQGAALSPHAARTLIGGISGTPRTAGIKATRPHPPPYTTPPTHGDRR